MGLVPGRDLVFPTKQRASETPSLFGQFEVLEIVAESTNKLERELGVVVIVESANEFLRPPGGEDLTTRVTRVE